ncbi:DUF3352 domain-containing protein [Candidatus Gracilibacteria bacterium]|nr:DUF3352 domain-containing protein [Candidatus Gracilibacteria bacterium]
MKNNNRKKGADQKSVFFMGFILFSVGVSGFFLLTGIFQRGKLDRIFSQEVAVFTEVKLNSSSLKKLKALFPEADLEVLGNDLTGNRFNLQEDLAPWIGPRVGLGIFPDKEFVVAASFRDKVKAKKFLEKFKLPDEEFQITKFKGAEIWTPKFSSQVALGIYRGYVFWGSSENALRRILESKDKIADQENYQSITGDLPQSWIMSLFIDSEKLVDLLASAESFSARKPLLEAFSQTLPALGIRAKLKNKGLFLQGKVLSEEGVFQEREISRSDNLMPQLAQFAPRDTLFFMNGSDLYEKYLHTKDFLEAFHPQFSLIFDGLLRANSRQLFGEKFDFEQDFLALMHGQYAVILDFQNALEPFVNFTLITGFGSPDNEQNLSQIKDVIHFAQGQFSAEVKEIELPDGTTREELVATDTKNIPIEKVDYQGQTYFTVQNKSAQGKEFSYAFAEGYFIFSTHEQGIISVLSAYLNKDSLAENEDFRKSVLFGFSPSESYGFFNFAKFSAALELLYSGDQRGDLLSEFLRTNLRNLSFARKVFPTEIFWTGQLFGR